ncbi:glycoside hydrolase family 16 protein [Lophiostoma macrostomum CBS 122681]|uniref:Glycoside hydrolase family 16 protein n=1 Tax=Lophiostoma macrostomum CBS 122681 TaxID=1314788 RepID=A0A6A6TCJ1_9PLEO|nr:glycoside hydrolase family 16 protein [Lophiostoma macrostomum CBS 122681]
MVRRALTAALAATTFAGAAFAQDGATCGAGTLCPESAPCCGQYGQCGIGAFCLGGCDVVHSHALDSCVPNPTCQDATYTFKDLNNVQTIDKYLGDPSSIDWQSQGKPSIYNDNLLLTLGEDTSGTLLASTHYVWYGNICAKLTTSQGKGVVTAFIMMSDVKDEIDFEFVGADIQNAQSNFYSQGVTVYTNGKNLSVDTTTNQHEYCVDWTEDTLKWSIDGNEMRSLDRKDTWNATSNRFDYPQTPARVMLSLWPAGISKNQPGTIEWSGGMIDWNSQYMTNGYYYAEVEQVTVKCYDPPDGVKKSGQKTYKYTDKAATNNTVEITDDLVILGSLYANGEDPDYGASTASGAQPTMTGNTVPGGNSGGGNRAEDQSSAAGQPTGAGGSDQPAATGDGGFSQGGNQGAGSSLQPGLNKVGGGAIAIVVAVLGLMVL